MAADDLLRLGGRERGGARTQEEAPRLLVAHRLELACDLGARARDARKRSGFSSRSASSRS
jgi:hypothetical protein